MRRRGFRAIRQGREKRWLPARWAATQRPTALLVIRLLILVNALLLAVIGALYLIFASRPGGLIVTGISWAAVALLVALMPYTNPRRHDRSPW